MRFPPIEDRVVFFPTTLEIFQDNFQKAGQPSAAATKQTNNWTTHARLKQLLSLSFMHKFYFKYFHYKFFQHYVITSNKQYNITLCFCKFLKRNTNTVFSPRSHQKAFFKNECPQQHPWDDSRISNSPLPSIYLGWYWELPESHPKPKLGWSQPDM